MASTLLPFLYQTRTLRCSFAAKSFLGAVRHAHSKRTRAPKNDNSIPFEWDSDLQDELSNVPGQPSTITPSEAEVFKGIFDEIAQGRMPASKKKPSPETSHAQSWATHDHGADRASGMARSIVEQARVTEFRDKFLRRYPQSLRNAAQVALGLYELEPGGAAESSRVLELDEADEAKREERARYDRIRIAERERVDALMQGCQTDAELWHVMEREVFSLPEKLGIAQGALAKGKTKTKGTGSARRRKPKDGELDDATSALTAQQQQDDQKRIMDVHGPLYPHFLSTGLALLDAAFARPSPRAFAILPRVKALGLPSYVLGVSAPFYARLARMHWDRFGDATAALDVVQEMAAAGLYADEAVAELLARIRNHLHGCTWGAQGPFVMAVMEAPPYDGALTQRLEEMERYARESMSEHEVA
ncbi:membrane-associating domain-containing protein [Purpureocillium lavendulum]|uniref:Membrane-associating domain-containing protein n=1 Tax=Purpureocillium lavendulum TaxID=1247861 RepID=A0AB34FYY1_9HYPO|nr:membrane-associating domain-containing protein [Purpureocillium lavendulum]